MVSNDSMIRVSLGMMEILVLDVQYGSTIVLLFSNCWLILLLCDVGFSWRFLTIPGFKVQRGTSGLGLLGLP